MISSIIVGIDESGRGPVLGPLVMVALAVKDEDTKKLEWMGVKDSKLLSSQVREELYDRIKEVVHDFRIEVIEPDAIDWSLQDEKNNLNWLEADTAARMVSEMRPTTIILDCPSPNIDAYKGYFYSKLSKGLQDEASLIVEHKADYNYVVVAAASVIAKVTRDRIIERIKEEVGVDFGSGYMSDPKTQEFLENYHDKYPHIFRKKWKSYQRVEEKKKQKTLGEF